MIRQYGAIVIGPKDLRVSPKDVDDADRSLVICSIHGCQPGKCFHLHNPEARRK